MVLVPATSLPAKLTMTPGDPGNGKCTPFPLFGVTCADAGADSPTQVPAFHLDKHETTVADYAACVTVGKCTAAGKTADCVTDATDPASCINRAQAAAFCAYAGKRLVRSLEQVSAAAGTAGRTYPWGNDASTANRLNACGKECKGKNMYPESDPWVTSAPVGSLPDGQTPEGVLDLAGNVAERVDATSAIVRGGSYATPAETSSPTIGFRCARDQ